MVSKDTREKLTNRAPNAKASHRKYDCRSSRVSHESLLIHEKCFRSNSINPRLCSRRLPSETMHSTAKRGVDNKNARSRLVQSDKSIDGLDPLARPRTTRKRSAPLKDTTNGRNKYFVKKVRNLCQLTCSRMCLVISASYTQLFKTREFSPFSCFPTGPEKGNCKN